MIQEGHLSVYDLTLTARGPVFAGNGTLIPKTGFAFHADASTLNILDSFKLLPYLVEHGFADQYEAFILGGGTDMHYFLTQVCHLTQAELDSVTSYRISAVDALDKNHSLKDICQFVRTPDHQLYIPGSTIKGALRTALLFGQISAATPGANEHLHNRFSFRDDRFLQVFQGIRISDSAPIPSSRGALVSRTDVFVTGETNSLNVMWECLPPETELHFTLTLDHAILDQCIFNGRKGLDVDTMLQALNDFAAYYQEHYLSRFRLPAGCAEFSCQDALWLGGGVGYFSKTLSYPYWKDQGLKEVSQFMTDRFPGHQHEFDQENGISPHMLHFARYGGKLYPMGLCGVKIT